MMKKLLFTFWFFLMFGCEDPFSSDQQQTDVFESFWEEVDRNYAFFDESEIDWDSIKLVNQQQINLLSSEQQLFETIDEMLKDLNDPHTVVYAPMGIAGPTNYFDQFPINQVDDMSGYFDNYTSLNRVFEYGMLKNVNLRYIRIKTFDGEANLFEQFDSLLNIFSGISGLIIDVRSNRGGLISNTEVVMKPLTDSTRRVAKYRARNGNSHADFSDWINSYIKPSGMRSFTKPIAVLTNRQTFSATEWFVLSAAVLPNVTIVGDTTGGGSGRPILRELPNGWLLRVSNTQTQLPSGRDFQFTGLYPDIPIWISEKDRMNNVDTILEQAIALLQNQ